MFSAVILNSLYIHPREFFQNSNFSFFVIHPDLDFFNYYSAIFIKTCVIGAFLYNIKFSSVDFLLCLLWSGGMLSLRAGKEEAAKPSKIKSLLTLDSDGGSDVHTYKTSWTHLFYIN